VDCSGVLKYIRGFELRASHLLGQALYHLSHSASGRPPAVGVFRGELPDICTPSSRQSNSLPAARCPVEADKDRCSLSCLCGSQHDVSLVMVPDFLDSERELQKERGLARLLQPTAAGPCPVPEDACNSLSPSVCSSAIEA
jgi:hypothetical protein